MVDLTNVKVCASCSFRNTEEKNLNVSTELQSQISLQTLQMSPAEEDEEFWGSLRRVASESEKTEDKTAAAPEETVLCQTPPEAANTVSSETEKCEEEAAAARPDSSEGDQEAPEEQAPVPREKIFERINSKKEMKSYQLGKQLSFKWTTGAGPRIGCVRDYPSELQLQALEQVNLSPRGSTTAAAASRFSSPLRRSFNQPAAARSCDASTPREASRSPLQHGALAVAAAAD